MTTKLTALHAFHFALRNLPAVLAFAMLLFLLLLTMARLLHPLSTRSFALVLLLVRVRAFGVLALAFIVVEVTLVLVAFGREMLLVETFVDGLVFTLTLVVVPVPTLELAEYLLVGG